jgi:hypothetical protein
VETNVQSKLKVFHSRIPDSFRGAARAKKVLMSTDSQKGVAGSGQAVSDLPMQSARVEYDPELAQLFKEREAEIQRILAQRKPELIQQGVEAYKRDLPRLLAENRYLQQVAYRGIEQVAIASTRRQLRKKLAKKGFTDWGELFVMTIAPLEIDEEDNIES